MDLSETFGAVAREKQREKPVIEVIRPDQNSDANHAMPPRHTDQIDTEAILNELRLLRQTNGNGGFGAWGRTFATMAVVLVGWVFTALYIGKTTETEIRVSNARLEEQLKQTREDFLEYRKTTERELKLADERYRQISIMLESRGMRSPRQ